MKKQKRGIEEAWCSQNGRKRVVVLIQGRGLRVKFGLCQKRVRAFVVSANDPKDLRSWKQT